jgi:protease II
MDFLVGPSHLVVLLRVNCSCRVWVYALPPGIGLHSTSDPSDPWGWLRQHQPGKADLLGQPDWDIPFNDTTLVVSLEGLHGDGAAGHALLTLHVTNLVTPLTIIECDLMTRTQAVRYVQPVLGGFQQGGYVSELVWATSADGVRVPMTVAWKKDLLTQDGNSPALLKG